MSRRGLYAGFAIAFAAIAVSAAYGQGLSWSRAFADASSIDHAILFRARLPRVAMGAVAGAGLAVTGAAYQGLLRNPLAEPYVLGVAGGAALGATIAIALASAFLLPPLLASSAAALSAAAFGGLATLVVWVLATRTERGDRGHATSILLGGVIVNAIASGAITFLKTVVRATTAQQLLFWLAGFLDVPTNASLLVVTIAVVIGGALLIMESPRLNLLALGDEQAAHLGVDVRALERRIFVASSIVVGAIVSTCGMVAFVGLLVPHVVRRLAGVDHRRVLPLSMLFGAATLVSCDLLSRVTFRALGTEPPVGAITALLGGPVFLVLLTRRSRDGA